MKIKPSNMRFSIEMPRSLHERLKAFSTDIDLPLKLIALVSHLELLARLEDYEKMVKMQESCRNCLRVHFSPVAYCMCWLGKLDED